jgi:ATP-dependent RNA helicase DHX37/DHR1
MKSLHIDAVVNFPFPTPPDQTILVKAETTLTHLGALLTPSNPLGGLNRTIGGVITDLGRAMSLFPLSPRFSRMLVSGRVRGCLPYIVSIVASLSVGDPFLHENTLGEGSEDEGDSGEDVDDKLSYIHSSAAKTKEVNRIRRRAFFQSQNVSNSAYRRSAKRFSGACLIREPY